MTGTPDKRRNLNRGSFRKGETGNARGRPRKEAKHHSAFDIVVERTLLVTRNGVVHQMSIEEALQHQTYRDAVAGERMALRTVLKWINERDRWLAERQPRSSATNVTVAKEFDPGHVDPALILLGIARPNPTPANPRVEQPSVLLESWAVEAALRRRRTTLTERQLTTARRCTQDGHKLRWPESGPE